MFREIVSRLRAGSRHTRYATRVGFGLADKVLTILALAAATVLWVSCSRQPSQGGKEARPRVAAAVPVLAAQATLRDVPVQIQTIGTVQAYSMVSVRPQITGPILKVHFEEGQEVKGGELLFTIDPRPWDAALNQARANLQRDEAEMINARLTFERSSNLFASKISSQQDYDTDLAGLRAAESTVLASRAAVTNAQLNLDYTVIRAPVEGRTGNLAFKAGNVVKATDDVLVSITQIRPIYVSFAVPEPHLSAIRRRAAEARLPVEAFVPGDSGHPARGELTFIDNMVDTNTGTILLKGTFANADNALWPGQYVQATLTLSNLASATVVPAQAVQTGQDGDFLFVVKSDGTVDARPVVGSVAWEGMRVILGGVEAGETVVTDGHLRLTPGAKVNVKSSETSGSTVQR
jgi:multidrug efflux system membrane fusion protein